MEGSIYVRSLKIPLEWNSQGKPTLALAAWHSVSRMDISSSVDICLASSLASGFANCESIRRMTIKTEQSTAVMLSIAHNHAWKYCPHALDKECCDGRVFHKLRWHGPVHPLVPPSSNSSMVLYPRIAYQGATYPKPTSKSQREALGIV